MSLEVPTFLGIGAQKAGTTWLYTLLRMHPDIGMPSQKELHFWDRSDCVSTTVAEYLGQFLALSGEARGEITPSYSILPADKISIIHDYLPNLRLIYILRNPIERAWSQANMELAREFKRRGEMPKSINSWLDNQLQSME